MSTPFRKIFDAENVHFEPSRATSSVSGGTALPGLLVASAGGAGGAIATGGSGAGISAAFIPTAQRMFPVFSLFHTISIAFKTPILKLCAGISYRQPMDCPASSRTGDVRFMLLERSATRLCSGVSGIVKVKRIALMSTAATVLLPVKSKNITEVVTKSTGGFLTAVPINT